MRQLLSAWMDPEDADVERAAVCTFHGLVASRWRDRRIFLAGDAAHQTPPFLGQGMCAGMRDVANLAWKLAAVIDGSPDELLDTYQLERQPHAQQVIDAAVEFGRLICMTDPEEASARDEAMLDSATEPSEAGNRRQQRPPLARAAAAETALSATAPAEAGNPRGQGLAEEPLADAAAAETEPSATALGGACGCCRACRDLPMQRQLWASCLQIALESASAPDL